uniref:MADF domain-containing protein n=1 Tax=Cuerna arida TaxID=1464854 RepID=A0A1B6GFH9_9HEMI
MSKIDKFQLVELVKERRVIWDSNCDGYRKREVTSRAWIDIYLIMNPKYNGMSEEEKRLYEESIRSKWTNLRDCYQRKFKKRQMLADNVSELPDSSNESHIQKSLKFLDEIYSKKSQNLKCMDSLNQVYKEPSKICVSKSLFDSDEETKFNLRISNSIARKDVDNAAPQLSSAIHQKFNKYNEHQNNGDRDNSRDVHPTTSKNDCSGPDNTVTVVSDDSISMTPMEKKDSIDNFLQGNEQDLNSLSSHSDHGSESGVEGMSRRDRHPSIKRSIEETEQFEEKEKELSVKSFLNNEILPIVSKQFNKKQILDFKSGIFLLISSIQYPQSEK